MNPEEIYDQIEHNKGNVPIRIDEHTIVFVKKEKCIHLENNTFILKPGETTNVKPILYKYNEIKPEC